MLWLQAPKKRMAHAVAIATQPSTKPPPIQQLQDVVSLKRFATRGFFTKAKSGHADSSFAEVGSFPKKQGKDKGSLERNAPRNHNVRCVLLPVVHAFLNGCG
jgi:hypothetical protein